MSFTLMHEASHRLIFSKHPMFEMWLGRLASLPLGIPYSVFLYNHMQHHAFTNREEKDPDMFIAVLVVTRMVCNRYFGERWLLQGQNFHQVHHANPRLPWYKYVGVIPKND